MNDDNEYNDELDGDDYTAEDVLDMIRANTAPREKGRERRKPTLADSLELHQLAGQSVTVTRQVIGDDGVTTTIEENVTVARPILGPLQEEEDTDE